jgi:regulator of sirC expression with transglutaminase-like and TPR domain
MNITNQNITEFKGLVCGDDEQIDLAYAALLIAKTEYPTIDIDNYMEKLDEMAHVVHKRLKGELSVVQMIFAINDYLYREQGFAGELDNYYDPRNSFLNDVLDRKRGIPLSLSLLYMEIGKRLGLQLQGVSFPGHFLVRLPVEVGHIVLDPFSGGASLSKDDLVFRLLRRYDVKDDRDELLSRIMMPASNSEILLRMLNNLKSSYVRDQDYQRALNATQFIMTIDDHEPEELKDRALLYDKLECPRAAAEDYHNYLELAPDDEDHEYLRERLIITLREGSLLH